jgi:YbgC/YbaW family acyl-CoA thioester hydrolase
MGTFEYRHKRRVEFADTDMAGIAHFTAFFRYVEEAEHALLRAIGFSVHLAGEGFSVGFPRVSARCQYERPVKFEDEVEIHLWIHKKGAHSIVYQFNVTKTGKPIAKGEVAAICCRSYADGRIESALLPAALDEKISQAPYPALEFKKESKKA